MTVSDHLLYGPLAGAVSLRREIVERAERAYDNARRMRAIIIAATAVISLSQLACRFDLLPMSAWVNERMYGISLSVLAATLLGSALVWSCQERMSASQGRLACYLCSLPSGDGHLNG